MRHVQRRELPAGTRAYLERRQSLATERGANAENTWRAARQTKAMATVFRTLREMAGAGEHCMYCVDSHGSDIEHFWPKSRYPDRTFAWPNMLLCCTECGRFKGDRFPLSKAGEPLLVDPSAEDPWQCLDFDPDTGNLTARYDAASGAPSPKGEVTVQVLHLDRREGMAEGYRRAYRRIVACVRQALAADDFDKLVIELPQADTHGLMGWCFGPIGARLQPFAELRRRASSTWAACITATERGRQ
ncbi:MAG: hypothetical protein IT478_14405 [Xanthomonadales bacterium]|nr:hypothetical protein [Xanthomonadales bacterium]MCC6562547.1 hypothetical protein [Xanthomonadales bacterium]